MPTGDGYDVSDLLDPVEVRGIRDYARAKRWAELAYMQGQWSRDAEIEKLRGAYRAALGAEAEAKERLVAVLDAYDKIAKAVDTTEVDRLRAALAEIKRRGGVVCAQYDACSHVSCANSYAVWAIADKALSEEKETTS